MNKYKKSPPPFIKSHNPTQICLYYRPQMKFAKVMFYTCVSVHGGGFCLSACWDTHTLRRHTPGAVTSPPRAVYAGRYRQQAGGTHPTGMHSCPSLFLNDSIRSAILASDVLPLENQMVMEGLFVPLHA